MKEMIVPRREAPRRPARAVRWAAPLMLVSFALATLALLSLTAGPVAAAEEETPRSENEPGGARGLREAPDRDPQQASLLVPRVLLFPARAAVYTVTYPVRTLAGLFSSSGLIERTANGVQKEQYFVPVVGLDPDPGVNAGFRAAHWNPLHDGSCITYRAAWGGTKSQVYAVTFRTRDMERTGFTYRLTGKYEITPYNNYFGIGNTSLRDNRAYFTDERYLFLGKFGYAPSRWMRWHLTGAVQRHQIERGAYVEGDEKSIEEVFPSESMAPGMNIDPQNFSGELALTLDFRNERGRPTSGFWGEGYVGYHEGTGSDGVNYIRYGGEAQGYMPLGNQRTFVLRVAGEEARTDGKRPIKITELMTLGGRSSLRGYHEDRFRDQASLLATAEYRYPISPFAEMCLFADFGKVMPRLLDFDLDDIHRSWGGGLRIAMVDEFYFRAQAAASDEDFIVFATLESAFQRDDRRDRR